LLSLSSVREVVFGGWPLSTDARWSRQEMFERGQDVKQHKIEDVGKPAVALQAPGRAKSEQAAQDEA
jgi:hypothetical protein